MFNISIIAGYVIPHMHKGVRNASLYPVKSPSSQAIIKRTPAKHVEEASLPQNSNPCRIIT